MSTISRKEMLETGRRTAISTSELGLYSDRGDRYNRNRHSPVVRKCAIGVMVVVAVILVGIFLYDFTSATSVHSKLNQESKHIYVLQNALKKSFNVSKKSGSPIGVPEDNSTDLIYIQDRSDNENYGNVLRRNELSNHKISDAELRTQNLNNFQTRKRVLKSVESKEDAQPPEGKQLFDNHAVVYRVRQRYKYPDSEEDASSEENQPTPFHWEFKTPQPASFKRSKYPQLSQYRYPHSSRNIQDIIKYLTNDPEMPNRGIKFSGVYVNPKKYDLIPEIGEMMSNSDRSEEDDRPQFPVPMNDDPFYQYKPKHPADVNLLATSNVRFSPTGLHRYSPFYDQLYPRPMINYNKQPTSIEAQYESPLGNNFGKRRKPKPFSVMLDIYPITDIGEQNKKNSRPRPQVTTDDFEQRRPIQYNRGPKFYSPPSSLQSLMPGVSAVSQQSVNDEEERQQMIFHLNLYPRKKNKLSRSESMAPDERQQFMESIMSPLETIAKHVSVEQSRFAEDEQPDGNSMPITRYQETDLDGDNPENKLDERKNDFSDSSQFGSAERTVTVPPNHKSIIDEDYASTEKYDYATQKIVNPTTVRDCEDCATTVISGKRKSNGNNSAEMSRDIDTVEGFRRFNDSVLSKG